MLSLIKEKQHSKIFKMLNVMDEKFNTKPERLLFPSDTLILLLIEGTIN